MLASFQSQNDSAVLHFDILTNEAIDQCIPTSGPQGAQIQMNKTKFSRKFCLGEKTKFLVMSNLKKGNPSKLS